jgi:hypothetical protein
MIWISAIGLVLSLLVNVASMLDIEIPMSAMSLHVGIFVVAFPSLLSLRRKLESRTSSSNVSSYRDAMATAQSLVAEEGARLSIWIKLCLGTLFVYGFACAAVSMLVGLGRHGFGRHALTPELTLEMFRTFSGGWIAFYSVFLALHWSAKQRDQMTLKCPKGHLIEAPAKHCAICWSAYKLPTKID